MNLRKKLLAASPLWHLATVLWLTGLTILIVALGIVVYNANHRSPNPPEIWLTIAFASGMFIASAVAYWVDEKRKERSRSLGHALPDDVFG
jgi:hypothetical protein